MYSKHTPDPWIAHEDGSVTSFGGGRVEMHVAKATGSQEIANARLIAAAPELLALLDRLVTTWDNYEEMGPDPLDSIIEAARAARAKARGEG